MPDNKNIKIFKYKFKAHITVLDIKAKISSPLTVNWKRSTQIQMKYVIGNESASSSEVEMVDGRAEINQHLEIPVNMYFDLDKKEFQQKKSVFNFSMRSPKGQKQVGVVYIDLAKPINEKIEILENTYSLQKCPVKKSEVFISVTHEYIGQKDHDTLTQNFDDQNNKSVISISSQIKENTEPIQNKAAEKSVPAVSDNKQLESLKKQLEESKQVNQRLKRDLQKQRELNKSLSSGDSSGAVRELKQNLEKERLQKSELQRQLNNLKAESQNHERQLQKVRLNMEKLYESLSRQLAE